MPSLSNLIERGIAEERYEIVSIFFNAQKGQFRLDLWSQPGCPEPQDGEVEVGGGFSRWSGPLICVQSHWGRFFVAREEVSRICQEHRAAFPDKWEGIPEVKS